MSLQSVITGICNGLVKDWNAAATWINNDVAAIKKVFPAAGSTIDAIAVDVKQGASDIIGAADSGLNTIAPELTAGVETLLDAALLKYTGGLALPLTYATNDAVGKVAGLLTSLASAWMLKAQAALAANNGNAVAMPTSGPGPVAPPQ